MSKTLIPGKMYRFIPKDYRYPLFRTRETDHMCGCLKYRDVFTVISCEKQTDDYENTTYIYLITHERSGMCFFYSSDRYHDEVVLNDTRDLNP